MNRVWQNNCDTCGLNRTRSEDGCRCDTIQQLRTNGLPPPQALYALSLILMEHDTIIGQCACRQLNVIAHNPLEFAIMVTALSRLSACDLTTPHSTGLLDVPNRKSMPGFATNCLSKMTSPMSGNWQSLPCSIYTHKKINARANELYNSQMHHPPPTVNYSPS